MKKFMKVTAIVGGIFLLVGLVVVGIGAIGGGIKDLYRQYLVAKTISTIAENFDLEESVSSIEDIIEKFENDEMADAEDVKELTQALGIAGFEDVQEVTDFLNSLEELESGDVAQFLDKFGINIRIDGSIGTDIFEDEYPVYSKGTYIFEDYVAQDLEIEVGSASLIVKRHEKDFIQMEVGSQGQAQCFVKEGDLHIFTAQEEIIHVGSVDSVTVYLPEDMVFDETTVEIGAGNVEFYGFTTNDMEVEVGAGNIVATELECGSLNMEVGLGSAEMEGKTDGDITIDCGMGAVSLKLLGEAEDYNYKMDCGMGAIDVDGIYSIAGIGGEKTNNNDAQKNVKIDCGMGSVEIKFEK